MSIHHKSGKFAHFHIAVPPSAMSPVGQQRKSSVGLGSRVEEGRGGGRLPVAMAGAFAAAPQSGLPWPRFPSPLIEPDVPISGIRLSDWLHRKAHGGRLARRVAGDVESSIPSGPVSFVGSAGGCLTNPKMSRGISGL